MMEVQEREVGSTTVPAAVRTLLPGHVIPLGSSGGKLEVLQGRVWLTRGGDPADHFVEPGESIVVPAAGQALVESWPENRGALVSWRPLTIAERVAAAWHAASRRRWDIVDRPRRVGVGAFAAVVALLAGALLFGPLSEARTRALLAQPLLHNSPGAALRVGVDAMSHPGLSDDVSARSRARLSAQQARRRAPGAA